MDLEDQIDAVLELGDAEDKLARCERVLRTLKSAAMKVPVCRRPDNGPPFSVCLGCESVDGDPCKGDCWVLRLEMAIHDARIALGDRTPRAKENRVK